MNKILVIGTFAKSISFAMQQNNVPIISRLLIKNISEETLCNVAVRITTDPQVAYSLDLMVNHIEASQIIELETKDLKLSPDFLFALSESTNANIIIKTYVGEEEIGQEIKEIQVLAYDQWAGANVMPEILASFVTKNHPFITKIIKNAAEYLQKWELNETVFTGYQSNNPNVVKNQLAAIFAGIRRECISFSSMGMDVLADTIKIRMCHELESAKIANSLDLSLLFASCMEAVGLHPLIILKKGYAISGCMLDNSCFTECIQDDFSLLSKKSAAGVNELCLVDCCGMINNNEMTFDEAVLEAERKLASVQEFIQFTDIRRCRLNGIMAMPVQILDENGRHYTYKEMEEIKRIQKDAVAPSLLKVVDLGDATNVESITKQEMWERKLLDLSLRNSLLNFRSTQSTVQISHQDLEQLEDTLNLGYEFAVLGRIKDFNEHLTDSNIYSLKDCGDLTNELIQREFTDKKLRTFHEESDMNKRLINLYRMAKTSLEENGVNTLYMALGFLKWYENDISEKARYAPLILCPIEIVRRSAQKGFAVKFREDEIQMNITLLEMLRADFDLDITGLDPIPEDENGADVTKVFTMVRRAIMNKPRWDVEELAFMGLFSFSQFIMWNDLRNRSREIKKNKVVASLVSGKMEWEQPDMDLLADNLEEINMLEMAVPLSADSSQLSAICAAAKNQSFVLHGPPGTGKSQTITNMIANALYQGKSVLFIAEKMAALSVVQKRLTSIGLGPFCLELHSNKARKKDVLDQLERVLAIQKTDTPQGYVQEARKIHTLRAELNEMMELLHKTQSFGLSLYDCIARALEYEDYKEVMTFSRTDMEGMTKKKYDDWILVCEDTKVAALAAGEISSHPLKEFGAVNYHQSLKKEVGEKLAHYIEKINRLLAKEENMANILQLSTVDNPTVLQGIIDFSNKYDSYKTIPKEMFLLSESQNFKKEDLMEKLEELCRYTNQKAELEERLGGIFSVNIIKVDVDALECLYNQAESAWFVKKMGLMKEILEQFRPYIKFPKNFKKDNIGEYLKLLKECYNCRMYIETNQQEFLGVMEQLPKELNMNWELFAKLFEASLEAKEKIRVITSCQNDSKKAFEQMINMLTDKTADQVFGNKKEMLELIQLLQLLDCCEDDLAKLCQINFQKITSTQMWIYNKKEMASKWINGLDHLRDWSNYVAQRDFAMDQGLEQLICGLEDGIIKADELCQTLHKNLSMAFVMYVLDDKNTLSSFSGAIFEREIRKFKEANDKFEHLTKLEIVARLSAKIPSTKGRCAESSEIGILNKTIKSRGRMMSIRKLFDLMPNLIRKLCPCMLMSPISVAQYIDPSFPKFDLVIFDEASQLSTCEAVGAIARGENLIVVGDPKQLPPTNFFSANRMEEDLFELEDMESILDDCLAIMMPQKHLLWHYRSKHESLIAFSNRQYYDNSLYTFPSPNDLVSEVVHVPVEGFYDRGKTKHNLAEAKAVVKEIVRRLKDKELCEQSIGVVTFSSIQQNLIDDLLMEEFAKHPDIEEINSKSFEPVFIKNLENVQGDERDVIMFSIGYGPDESGKVALNFGPLNRDGGWRRLNVAVSRARNKMLVFSVLRPEQIDLSKTSSDGLAGLKAFLEFSMYGKNVLPLKIRKKESGMLVNSFMGMEKIIAKAIETLGYQVVTGIGCSSYRVDIGVIHPQNKEEYILGIMCDGANYTNARTARDRNILQEGVLRSLGWNLYRIWTLDWWENPQKELEKLAGILDGLLYFKNGAKASKIMKQVVGITKENCVEETVVNNVVTLPEEDKSIDQKKDYQICDLSDTGMVVSNAKEFVRIDNTFKIRSQVVKVIKEESPISRSLLTKRVLMAWGITRKGIKIEERFDEILKSLKLEQTISNDQIFYWKQGQKSSEYKEFRIPTDAKNKRALEEISSLELANGINYILKNQVSLSNLDLEKETARLFGYNKLTQCGQMAIGCGIEEAIKRGYVMNEGNRVVGSEFV